MASPPLSLASWPFSPHDCKGHIQARWFAAGYRQRECIELQEVVMSLKGKTAVVTGSTSGIGHGIALALARQGVNIIVNGLGTETDNAKAIAEVKAIGVRVAFDPANMLRNNQIADMIAKAERDF